jgi:soluble lytic murein transglycosylase-like protein
MIAAAKSYSVPVAVLFAVALTESGQKGLLRAYALNVDGRPIFSETLQEALERFAEASRSGARFIDVGCMQIDHHFHGKNFQSMEEMFDPHRNVQYAAKLLGDLKAREGSWTSAVARYHAGPGNPRAQKSYVCAVIANMIGGGFGSWTREATDYCQR